MNDSENLQIQHHNDSCSDIDFPPVQTDSEAVKNKENGERKPEVQSNVSFRKASQRTQDVIDKFVLFDDIFFNACMKDNIPAVQEILRIIMEIPDLVVMEVTIQESMPNLFGHSITFDVKAEDAGTNQYDIEVQRRSEGGSPRRARYHHALMDSRMLEKNSEYNSLRNGFVIFITEHDLWKRARPKYEFVKMEIDLHVPLDDGSKTIYVNGAYRVSSCYLK